MIKNSEKLTEFENNLSKTTPPDHEKALKVFESLYQEARQLGVFPLKDPMEGIEHDIKLAKALNSV